MFQELLADMFLQSKLNDSSVLLELVVIRIDLFEFHKHYLPLVFECLKGLWPLTMQY